jgi:hypothetical protein
VAIYHLSVKPISRSGGRSATAAAAYRSGELVHDLQSDETFDYTRKRGVEHTEIVLPTAAAKQDINWARDRQALWNAAEAAENRSNSRVAREYELALPHEMTKAQRVELVQAFSQRLADRFGVAVDIAIHAPHRNGDTRNHHAHLLTTTRVIEAAGLGDKSEIEWSDTNRRKAGLEPARQEIKVIRADWEGLTNERFQALKIEARIDHRSLEAQGIEREPSSHLGPAVNGMERRGIETEVGKRIAWEAQFAAQQRLERAAELGRLEREKTQVNRSILDLSGDLDAARQERATALDGAPKSTEKEPHRRGRFEGLKLDSGPLRMPERAPERVPESALLSPELVRDRALEALQRSVDRYARAWMDALQTQAKKLPALEHQKIELKAAGEELDQLRPGMSRDINTSVRYEPKVRQAMMDSQGNERVVALIAGAVHEGRIRRDPNLRAERLLKEWNGLEARRQELKGSEHTKEREKVVGRVRELAIELKKSPELEMTLKRRGQELGIEATSRLGRVIEERDLNRALSISERELTRSLGLGLGR